MVRARTRVRNAGPSKFPVLEEPKLDIGYKREALWPSTASGTCTTGWSIPGQGAVVWQVWTTSAESIETVTYLELQSYRYASEINRPCDRSDGLDDGICRSDNLRGNGDSEV